MKISSVAKKASVGVETVRFYERKALITQPPKPSNGGFRSYPDETVERVRFIRQAQSLGFSLKEIGELLALKAEPSADCGDIRERALVKREAVDRKIEQLAHIRDALDDLIAACPGRGALRSCSILGALYNDERDMAPSPESKEEACGQCID
jgi:Hg(II)-responsive transcriptional regulator